MIDFNTIPTNEDWDNLIPGKYYPDNEYEDFYGKSYTGKGLSYSTKAIFTLI